MRRALPRNCIRRAATCGWRSGPTFYTCSRFSRPSSPRGATAASRSATSSAARWPEPSALRQKVGRAQHVHGAIGEEVAPDPIVMAYGRRRVEMGTIAESVAIGNDDDGVIARDRRPHRGVDTEVGGPAGNEKPVGRDPLQDRLKVGCSEGVVERLFDDDVRCLSVQFRQELPTGLAWLEVVAGSAAMTDPHDVPRAPSHQRRQAIYPRDDT